MARYLLIDSNNVVVNVCEWDGNTKTWTPPDGITTLQHDTANIGDIDDNGVFSTPAPKPPEPDSLKDIVSLLVAKNLITQQEADTIGKPTIAQAVSLKAKVRP